MLSKREERGVVITRGKYMSAGVSSIYRAYNPKHGASKRRKSKKKARKKAQEIKAIAAHYFGCDFVGMEIDEDYYKAAVKRFNQETAQLDMF
jgi:hypothetical protein